MSCMKQIILSRVIEHLKEHHSSIPKTGSNFLKKNSNQLGLLIFIFLLGSHMVTAQSYATAGGIRLGTEIGFTVQQRIAKHATIEAILQTSLQRKEVLLTALFERHYPIIIKRFNVYAGVGLHKGWETDVELDYGNPLGITAILGAEFTIARFNISYDFKPAINLSGGVKTFDSQTSISARYVIVTQKKFEKRRRQKARDKRKKKRQESGKFNWRFWEK